MKRTLSGCPPSQAPQSLTPDLRLPLKGEEEKPKKSYCLRPLTLDIRHSSDNYAKSAKNGVICENEMSGKSRNFAVRLDRSLSIDFIKSLQSFARDLTASIGCASAIQTSLIALGFHDTCRVLRCKASLTRLENHSLLALLENTWRVCSRSTN